MQINVKISLKQLVRINDSTLELSQIEKVEKNPRSKIL